MKVTINLDNTRPNSPTSFLQLDEQQSKSEVGFNVKDDEYIAEEEEKNGNRMLQQHADRKDTSGEHNSSSHIPAPRKSASIEVRLFCFLAEISCPTTTHPFYICVAARTSHPLISQRFFQNFSHHVSQMLFIQVEFTPRLFPTPLRESKIQDEEDWIIRNRFVTVFV